MGEKPRSPRDRTSTCPNGPFGAPVCDPNIQPGAQPEVCGNGLDDDCDGQMNDADVCVACVADLVCGSGIMLMGYYAGGYNGRIVPMFSEANARTIQTVLSIFNAGP